VKRLGNGGVTDPIRVMFQRGRDKDNSSGSLTLTDQPSALSIYMESIHNPDSTTVQDSPSADAVSESFYTAKSFDESGMQDECQSSPPAGTLLTTPPAFVLPHFSDASGSTMPVHACSSVETV
jgi:hypothetical protein